MTINESKTFTERLDKIWSPETLLQRGLNTRQSFVYCAKLEGGLGLDIDFYPSDNELYIEIWGKSSNPDRGYMGIHCAQGDICNRYSHPLAEDLKFEEEFIIDFTLKCWLSGAKINPTQHEKMEFVIASKELNITSEELQQWGLI